MLILLRPIVELLTVVGAVEVPGLVREEMLAPGGTLTKALKVSRKVFPSSAFSATVVHRQYSYARMGIGYCEFVQQSAGSL